AQAKLVADRLDLAQVAAGLATGLEDGFQGRAGESQLAGRLPRHRGAVLGQRDLLAVLVVGFPAVASRALQKRAAAARASPGRRAQVVEAEAERLVPGTDPPPRRRLAAGLGVRDRVAPVAGRAVLGDAGSGHGLCLG